MDRVKQIDVIRKRNMDLTDQIKDLQLKLEYNKQLNSQGYQAAKELIQELEAIKGNWLEALRKLYETEAEYQGLISDMRNMITTIRGR